MSKKSSGIAIRRPVKVWNKPLEANFKDLFKALSRLVVDGVTGDWTKAGVDAADAVAAVGFDKDVGQLGWLLIHRALTRAIYELVGERAPLMRPDAQGLESLVETFGLTLEEAEVAVDQSFLERPKELEILQAIRPPLEQWMIGAGLSAAQAKASGARLAPYFVFALNQEWCNRPARYAALKQAWETPFTQGAEREQAWRQVGAWLEKQVELPMFDEAFSLRQVYVPLRAIWKESLERNESSRLTARVDRERAVKRHVVDLGDELAAWIERGDPLDAIRVLSGGPGSGKSSSVKIFAAEMARRSDLRVLFVPLHHFEPRGELRNAIDAFAEEDPILPSRPIDPKARGERILLIFDGLDELAVQGKIAKGTAQTFVRAVDRMVDRLNQTGLRIQVVISGRELVIQENLDEFPRLGQVLHLLPYLVSNQEEFEDPGGRLAFDQRQNWWKRYGECVGSENVGFPEELGGSQLQEITAEPLLSYLFALSFDRGKIDFSLETNLNSVYEDLLLAVYERGWDRRKYRPIQGISLPDFVRILEEIALAAWHGDGLTTTVRDIQRYSGSRLDRLLNAFQESADEGVTRFLAAFYFRQSEHRDSGDQTFEFTHKSFGEYLTTRRIIRTVETIELQYRRRQKDPNYGWNKRNALREWASVCGPTSMEHYLFNFLCREAQLRGQERCLRWQEMLADLIGSLLHQGLPMEQLEPRLTYGEQKRQARNAEEALLATLNACARVSEDVSEIDWVSEVGFGTWLATLRGQRKDANNVLALDSLSWLLLARQTLHSCDLCGANLERASLDGANLEGANLSGANLNGANLDGANLFGANLGGSILDGSNLDGARLDRANLTRASLQGANLAGARLDRADLNQAKNLRQAQIERAHGDRVTKLPPHLNRPRHWS